jgi:hypothetical protein
MKAPQKMSDKLELVGHCAARFSLFQRVAHDMNDSSDDLGQAILSCSVACAGIIPRAPVIPSGGGFRILKNWKPGIKKSRL